MGVAQTRMSPGFGLSPGIGLCGTCVSLPMCVGACRHGHAHAEDDAGAGGTPAALGVISGGHSDRSAPAER